MSNPTHEQLLGYVLDACDGDERQKIEQQLQQDESLRQRCDLLRKAIDPLALDGQHLEPPKGLAQRCCEFIYSRVELMPAALTPVGASAAVSVKGRRWSWLDVVVATAVAAAVLFLVAPAVYQSRQNALRATCQNNLKDIGTALTTYSDLHGGSYPTAPLEGKMAIAGLWDPLLRDHLPNGGNVSCPSSSLGCGPKQCSPRLEELRAMDDTLLEKIAPQLGGGIGFTLGYDENGQYKVHVHRRRPHFVVASDAPGPGGSNSLNHGGAGQNVLFEDGRVIFVSKCQLERDEDIFHNASGEIGPGKNAEDSVIVPGHFRIRIYFRDAK